jgi:glycosyltransferase involved in cell wall biosynthesis
MSSSDKSKLIQVCFIAPKAYPLFNPDVKKVFGGAEVDLYLLATELAKDENFAVSFITADYGQEDIETIENVRVIKSLDFNKNPLIGAVRVWQAMHAADAQVYLQKTVSWGTPLVTMFCKSNKRIFVYRTANQGECNGTFPEGKRFLKRAFSWSLHKAGAVTVQNKIDKKNLHDSMGIDATVIPNGHRLAESTHKQRDTVLWVGRSSPLKRPELFIKLAEHFPDEKFTMICQQATGDENYQDLLAQAKKVDNLQFVQAVPFPEISSYFQRAKVLVNTSDSEGFANTFIQACMAATPILSLNVNPDGFLYRYKCGICADRDWEKFIEGCKILAEPPKTEEYGQNGRRYVEQNHDVTKIIEQYKELFRRLVVHSEKTTQFK